jgi:protein associated with RNAse G/E
MIKVGDLVTFRSLHADGSWYRQWQTTIESITDTQIVTYSPPNSWFDDINRGIRKLPRAMRCYYWRSTFYNLLEVIESDSSIAEVYLNVASPLQSHGDEMHFVDYELDVIKLPGQLARIIDQDEFEQAIGLYGYSAEFQAKCWQAAEEARLLAERWLVSNAH